MLKSTFRSLEVLSSDRLALYHGMASIFLLRFIQLGMGLTATYFLARSMSKDVFGEYNMVLNMVGILTIFSLSGLNNSIMQAVARGYTGTYRATVPIAFGSSFLGSTTLLGAGTWYWMQGQAQLGQGLLVAAVLFPFAHGLVQWKSVVTGSGKFGQLLIHDGLTSILSSGLIIAAVLKYRGQYVIPIILALIVPAIYNVVLTVAKYRQIPADAPVEKENFLYGIKTTFYSGLGAIGTNLDRVLLFFFLSPAALAVFVAAGRIPDLLSGTMQDVSAVLAPRMAKHESYTKQLDRIFGVLSLTYGIVIVLFGFTGMPYVVTFLFGNNYTDAIPYAQALTCSVAIGHLANLRFRYIRSKIDARGFRDVTLISSAVRLGAFLLLVPPFGLVGAVISTFIYRLALMGVVRVVIKRHYAVAA
jgi:O-antigen/teichoic acid export membrane protein